MKGNHRQLSFIGLELNLRNYSTVKGKGPRSHAA
jgi:hypothetical protein